MASFFTEQHDRLASLLDHRRAVVERLEAALLNVRGKPITQQRSRPYFEHLLHTAIFGVPGLSDPARRPDALRARHLQDGFEPVQLDRFTNELDPLELVLRAYDHWEQTRWPGQAGRLTFAHAVFAVFLLRQLEYLSLAVWDDGVTEAGAHLAAVQHLLDRLNDPASSPSPVLVRDARWLMQTAQGPFTRHLAPYFAVATRVGASFDAPARLGIHDAAARLAGGHLRSQLRYQMWASGHPLDDPRNLVITRNSNAMDGALLVRDLVPLLGAYREACATAGAAAAGTVRLRLADGILQGLSADPELLVTRLDLLGPYTMVEEVFVAPCAAAGSPAGTPPPRPALTEVGATQVSLLGTYAALLAELAPALRADAAAFDPRARTYSPYGISYGFCADLLANLVLDRLVTPTASGIALEDVFESDGRLEEKRARADAWARLPRRPGEREHFDHEPAFAAMAFTRLTDALDARVDHPHAPNASGRAGGRLFVLPEVVDLEALTDALPADVVLADEYVFTTNLVRAKAGAGTPWVEAQVRTDRQEARYLASVESGGHWTALSKALLTLVLAQGADAVVTGIPPAAIDVLRLTCPGLLIVVGAPAEDREPTPEAG